jgi:sulfur-oxidizing protein SoxY
MEHARRWACALAFAALAATPPATHAQAADANLKWQALKYALFGDREVNADASGVLELFVRKRAEDASTVPVLIRARIDQTPERYIKRIYLIIDENPSPFGVRFTLTPESGRADIQTRVRLESSSPVRAVAELNDGSLWMQSSMVHGAGGCSAPIPDRNQEETLGEMRMRVDGNIARPGQPVLAQLLVRHPQYSGMASNSTVPPHFVRQVNVYYADRLVMTADVDFTISENPSFRFYFLPAADGVLRVEVVDSTELRFEHAVAVQAPK